jgi:hypothetical protein
MSDERGRVPKRMTGRSSALPVVASIIGVVALALGGVRAVQAQPAVAREGAANRARLARGAESVGSVVVIPHDWKLTYPLVERFAAPLAVKAGGAHLVDLAATRFFTDPLVSVDGSGQRTFLPPDMRSFSSQLVRTPFESGSSDLFIVQAGGPTEQVALRRWLQSVNVKVLGYIPDFAYLARLDQTQLAAAQLRQEVFWVGSFQPAFMVEPKLDYVIEQDGAHPLELRADFALEDYPDAETLAAALQGTPVHVLDVTRMSDAWSARVAGRAMDAYAVAVMPGCLWVERFVEFELNNNVARTSTSVPTGRGASSGPIMDVERVWAKGIRGEGQIAAAADTGLSTGDLTTANNFHYDFGQTGSATNPMRVVKGYALNNRSTWSDNQTVGGGHGTHTSGSILGNGFRSGSTPSTNTFPTTCYAGAAPKAGFVFQSVMNTDGSLGGIPADLTQLFQAPYNDGARVHSNSWGAAVAGAYNTDSQNVDKFVWNNQDMVITFSAGNSGVDCWYWTGTSCQHPGGCSPDGVIDTDSIGSPGTAKNCITVGASENYRPDFQYGYGTGTGTCQPSPTWSWFNGCDYSLGPVASDLMADNADGMGAFSSRGPCDDGRIKPDLVAPGIAIISTRTDVNQAYQEWGTCNVPSSPTDLRPYYVANGGTSMANPLTAGSAVLVRQYYTDGWHPNNSSVTNASASAPDGFDPSAALVKATLVNGAWDMSPGQYGTGAGREIPPGWDSPHDLPNDVEGFGRVDLYHALFPNLGYGADPGRTMEVHDNAVGLSTGGTATYTFLVSTNVNPLIATLAWSDPYAATGAGAKLVNDLDLEVTSPSATRYYPNRKDWTGGSRDSTNNVEQVYVTSPTSGMWTITVRGYNVPGNGQPGTTAQPFALVISGVSCTMAAPASASATPNGDNRIDVSWAAVGGAAEYHVYRSTTSGGGYAQVATVTAPTTAWSDTSVSGSVTYYYVVRAYGSGLNACESANSPEASATATGTCALPPSFAGLVSVTASPNATCTLDLSWGTATRQCGGAGSVTYAVYRSTSSGFTPSLANRIAVGLTVTSYSDAGAIVYGTVYYYVVRATDTGNGSEDGNTVQKSGTPAGTVVTTTLFSDTFESGSGLNGWEANCFGTGCSVVDWRGIQACAPAHSGSNIFRFGGSTCAANYGNGDNAFVAPGGTSGITIPADATTVRLSFWHRRAFESGYDGAFMRISTDNQTFYYIPASTPGVWVAGGYTGTVYYPAGQTSTTRDAWTGTDSNFTNTVMDLDAACNFVFGGTTGAAGRTLWIAFGGFTNGTNTDLGWFVDDVSVTAQVPGTCTGGFTLTVTKAGTGTGTVSSNPAGIDCGSTCSAGFTTSTPVTLSAAAGPGSTFAGWSGEGCSGTGTCQVTMDQVRSVTATFTLNTYTLTVTKSGTGTGTVTSNPSGIACGATCGYDFAYPTLVTLTAVADAGSTFAGWSGEGCSGTGPCQVTMTQARSVIATFTSCAVVISNQTVTTMQTYTSCSTLTLGPAFRVAAPGDVTARAATRVILTNGFSVGSGASFTAGLDPSLAP